MTTNSNNNDNDEEEIAEAFGRNIDPLAGFEETFDELDLDPFDYYLDTVVAEKDLTDGTVGHYERAYEQWREFMAEQGRHPACPTKQHVKRFATYWKEVEGNQGKTVAKKLNLLNLAFTYMQEQAAFPQSKDFSPFDAAMGELDLSNDTTREYPRVSLDELREQVGSIDHVLDRALTVMQLKTGARSSEICNIRLSEVHVSNPDVRDYYDQLGTHPQLEGRPNAVYIPPDRNNNKRKRPTVLPLDEETRQTLVDWLLVRPDTGMENLFLTRKGKPMDRTDLKYIWETNWWPKYESEDDGIRSISPHYARHFFTTWWTVKEPVEKARAKYMRGDKDGGDLGESREAIYEYVHTYYEDIEDIYRERMFQLYL